MDQVRFGIVGAGRIAQLVAWVFNADPAIAAVAVADVDTEAAGRLAATLGISDTYADYRQLLARDDIDAVYIATPPFLHGPMMLDALTAGKHVLCEKPFVLDVQQAEQVLSAARSTSLRVGCCSCRFHDAPTTRRARELVETGQLGEIYRLSFVSVSRPARPGAAMPAWRNDASKNGGGIAFDWGAYDLDWMAYVLGDRFRPRRLFGVLGPCFHPTEQRRAPAPDVDGRLAAELLCDDGMIIHWERRAGEHGPRRHCVELRGTRAGLDLAMTPDGDHGARLVHHAYRGDEELATTVLPEVPPEWRGTLVYPLRDFARAILEDRPPASPPERQLTIHAVLQALYASDQTGESVVVGGDDTREPA